MSISFKLIESVLNLRNLRPVRSLCKMTKWDKGVNCQRINLPFLSNSEAHGRDPFPLHRGFKSLSLFQMSLMFASLF